MKEIEIMKAGVAQVKLYNDIDTNLATISKYLALASKEDIDILCFPECNITGYVRDFSNVNQNEVMDTLNNILKKVRDH
jgi:predicted amidohydrolase